MNLEERLREVMEAKHWSEEDLVRVATKAGVSRSAVSQWLGKGSKEIKSIGDLSVALALQEATGFRAQWIAKGIEPKMADPTTKPQPPLGDITMLDEAPALYATIMALIATHPEPSSLLSAFDAVVSGMQAGRSMPAAASAAIERFRAQIARQAGGRNPPTRQ